MCVRDRTAIGADLRRGPFGEGERIQLTDPKGRLHTITLGAVSYTHLRAHETVLDLVCRLLLEKKTTNQS